MDWFRKMGVGKKLLLLNFLQVFSLLLFAGVLIYEKYQTRQEMAQLKELAHLGRLASSLVHELQRERGMTSGFLTSKGLEFVQELPPQRKATDDQRQTFETYAKSLANSGRDHALTQRLSQVQGSLNRLTPLRQQVDGNQVSPAEAIGFFNQTNAELLDILSQLSALTADGAIASELIAFNAFLQAKERAGIERAVLTGVFVQDAFGPGQYNRWLALVEAQNTYLAQFRALATPPQLALADVAFKSQGAQEVERLRQIAQDRAASGGFGVQGGTWFQRATEKINQLKTAEEGMSSAIGKHAQALEEAASQALKLFALGAAASLLLLLWVSRVISQGILQLLGGEPTTMVDLAQDIAKGDLTAQVQAQDPNSLAGALAGMVASLSQMLSQIMANSFELNHASEVLGKVAVDLSNSSVEGSSQSQAVAASVDQMTATINNVTFAIRQVAHNLENTASNATQISANMQGVQASTQGLTGFIAEVSQSASQSDQVVKEASRLSAAATEIMGSLADSAQNIGGITGMIKELADQTNLLALNANIEAAGAGDYGKVFAVVANEVKDLARQSAQAAQNIAKRISGIQQQTKEAAGLIDQMDATITQIGKTSSAIAGQADRQTAAAGEIRRNVDEAAQAVAEMARLITEMNAHATSVVGSAEELVKGATEVSRNVNQIAVAAQETAMGSTQVQEHAQGLTTVSARLERMINHFQLSKVKL